jgi:hypothetical protein
LPRPVVTTERGRLRSAELDVPPVEEPPGADLVLEVDPAGGTREAARAAARGDRVLAAPLELRAGRDVRVPLGLELEVPVRTNNTRSRNNNVLVSELITATT